MPVTAGVSAEQYLAMSFDGPDREFVHGEIVERNMGDLDHSTLQIFIGEALRRLRQQANWRVQPELRHRISEGVYRIPDIAVHPATLRDKVPSSPPLIVVEIVSPDDRYSALLEKLREYAEWGVKHIWIVDPQLRQCAVYTTSGLTTVDALSLEEYGFTLSAAELFAEL
ncbi:MAG: Uma2 family endonuclease [Bryobacteraceae bacterium]|nr:Uma2 family endonuclease [Bryobacteraceae bacterium]